jgi:hypothetical protein
MPRRRSQSQTRGLLVGTVAVLFGVVLLAGLSIASGKGKVDVSNLGDKDYWAGNADRLAARIVKDKRPFLIPDASPNHAKDIYLQHIGASDTEGWLAIDAGPRRCSLQWDEQGLQFVDPCTGATHPPDGSDLTRYRTYVEGNGVFVDLRTTVK